MDVYHLWMWIWLIGLLVLWAGTMIFAAWTDRRRPRHFEQRDIVAERHRRITRRAFKTRAGMR
jgi:hypothetical protein